MCLASLRWAQIRTLPSVTIVLTDIQLLHFPVQEADWVQAEIKVVKDLAFMSEKNVKPCSYFRLKNKLMVANRERKKFWWKCVPEQIRKET